jgi:hypothetical protein
MASPEKSITVAAKKPAPGPLVSETMKNLLADPKDRIRLDDYVTGLLKSTINTLAADTFWQSVPGVSAETFQARLDYYDATIDDLLTAVILLSRWGQAEQLTLLERIFSRLAEANKNGGGLVAWQSGRWYPVSLLLYAAGITALAFGNHPVLRPTFLTPTDLQRGDGRVGVITTAAADEMHQLDDMFKLIPAHARNRVPVSEFIFAKLRARLDDLLYLGNSYERYFDEYEILAALVYVDQRVLAGERVWAMPGRFGYKFMRDGQSYDTVVREAATMGENWPVLRAELFGGSSTRFQEVAKSYRQFLTQLNWY